MAQINIRRSHSLSLAQARKEANVMAEQLRREFDLESKWSGNTLSFTRSGVDGVMTLSSNDVHVAAELGFVASFLKSKIEARLHAHFDEIFGRSGEPSAAVKAKATKTPAAATAAPAKKKTAPAKKTTKR